ncbi:gpt [Symbiodinium necroappetens]|uniref:Gpt protein n=1 Tax=Symbiodinium necroappetens TaxID=1628268 RepID=A0A813BGB0_9DINO|nr:gpt [Symbiodinium necroappetens]
MAAACQKLQARQAPRALSWALGFTDSIRHGLLPTQGSLRFKCLTRATINQKVLEAEYAVRGRLPTRAAAIQAELANGAKYPFSELVHCNIGNPQQVGQVPLSFNREVLALLTAPRMLERADELVRLNLVSAEAAERAREYSSKSAKVGAYTDSVGFKFIREEVCDFIARRDGSGHKPDISQVFLTNGASEGVRLLMSALAAPHLGKVGIMAPIPQYPLYSALSTLMDCELVGYYLDEENKWAVSVPALTAAYEEATRRGVIVRALVVINPGNPSGNNLTAETLEQVVSFAHEKGLVLLADEVYQENVLTAHPFKSMSSIVREKQLDLEIASFHSLSKGFLGECGVRGGYCVFENFDPEVMEQFVKLKSVELCSNTVGQLSVGLMVRPPCADAAALYDEEKQHVLDSLRQKSQILHKTLSSLPGISLQEIGGAMYAFPQVKLPKAAIEAAEAQGVAPDEFYCMQALESTGLVVVPGSGFRQLEGTFHFRTTFLPTLEQMQRAMASFAQFHTDFMRRYA